MIGLVSSLPCVEFRPLLKRIAADDAGVEAADVSGAALGPDFAAALAAALRGNTHVTRVDAHGTFFRASHTGRARVCLGIV